LFTVTVGKSNVGVAVTVEVDVIVGVNVEVGVKTFVGVRVIVSVADGVSVEAFTVAVSSFNAVVVAVVCCSVEGTQAETNRKINKMILWTFI